MRFPRVVIFEIIRPLNYKFSRSQQGKVESIDEDIGLKSFEWNENDKNIVRFA